jgi:hypothetical protein
MQTPAGLTPRKHSRLLKWRGRSPVERAAATFFPDLQDCSEIAMAELSSQGDQNSWLGKPAKPRKICLGNYYSSVIMRHTYEKNVPFWWN